MTDQSPQNRPKLRDILNIPIYSGGKKLEKIVIKQQKIIEKQKRELEKLQQCLLNSNSKNE